MEAMNLVALVLLILHIFIVSCVDAGKVVLMDSNITPSFDDMEADFCELLLDSLSILRALTGFQL